MRALGLIGVLALGIGPELPTATAAEKGDAARARRLVAQLGSDDYREREQASRALSELGGPAIRSLQQALGSPDLEVRRRARELLPRIELRLVRQRALAPRRVRLRCKDLPVARAVALLARESGNEVVLYDPKHALKDRKVTLDTGETTFWDALDQLCAKAGLLDWDPNTGTAGTGLEPPAGTKPPGGTTPGFPGGGFAPGGFPGGMPAGGLGGFPPGGFPGGGSTVMPGTGLVGFGPGQSVLVPGKSTRVPADTSTSVRVRFSRFAGFGPPAKDVEQVVLQITPEGRLRWLQTVEVKITEAVDDRGQKRTTTPLTAPILNPYGSTAFTPGAPPFGGGFPGGAGPGIPGGWGVAGGPGMAFPGAPGMAFPGMPGMGSSYTLPLTGGLDTAGGASHRYLRLSITRGDRPATALQVLRGTIKAWVQLENENLLTAEDFLAGKGKTRAGKYGVALEVMEVARGSGGRVTVKFRLELPEMVEPDLSAVSTAPAESSGPGALPGGGPGMPGGAMPLPGMGGPGGMPPSLVPAQGFLLSDHRGKPLPANFLLLGNNATDPTTVYYQVQYVAPRGGADRPVKLIFRGRRSALLEVPFTLKDVPLR
jgi:hypothetical protein